MKNWRTEYVPEQSQFAISHRDDVVLMGSCFAENIGDKLAYSRFRTTINPTGILYNPIALEQMLYMIQQGEILSESHFLSRQDQVFHYDFHSDFHAKSKQVFTEKFRHECKCFPKKPHVVIISLGTAWVYEKQGEIVGNCHKQDQNIFTKRLLTIEEIKKSLLRIAILYHETQIIVTVSPVRHMKDGMVQNQQSKAHLITAIHQAKEANPQISYFPSYEIMMDDLRDYRFYKRDLLHPSEEAVDYIWDKFSDKYFTKETHKINKEISSIQKMKSHKAIFPESDEHKLFLEVLKRKETALFEQHPYLQL